MINLGLWLPTYGGWLAGVEEEEKNPTYDYAKRVALKAEEKGIDSLWIPDHLLNPIKGEDSPSLEAWTLAVGIAEATDRINISHTTLCEAFRYPAVLAKQAVTMADLSDDRFWLSLGAGWFKREYIAYGLPWQDHDERVDRAEEAIKIIKRLWNESHVGFDGKYYSVESGTVEPKPEPKPPVWYGGNSEASRRLIAKEADGWLMGRAPLDKVKERIEDMNSRLEEKGRDRIEFAVPALVFVRGSDQEAEKHVKNLAGENEKAVSRILNTGLVGSPETIARKVQELEEAGIDHLLLHFTPTLPELKRFADEVLPLITE
ncbi:MAG: LLM class flavin-dependent oxidoreductase [Candidatus Bipolaricaulia bacterium]